MDSFFQTVKTVPLNHYIILSSIIFSIGVIGVLLRRNAIIIFMSVELMLNAVNLLLTAFSVYHGDPNGQVFVFFIMALAAAEVALVAVDREVVLDARNEAGVAVRYQ